MLMIMCILSDVSNLHTQISISFIMHVRTSTHVKFNLPGRHEWSHRLPEFDPEAPLKYNQKNKKTMIFGCQWIDMNA